MIRSHSGGRILETVQMIDRPRSEVFAFFANPANLEAITPVWLRFRIVGQTTAEIVEGTELTYRLRIRGFPLTWRSVIAEWRPEERFVDVQLQGPYAEWHHTHSFEEIPGGTLIRDRVRYRLPLGGLGRVLAGGLVDRDVERIFRFRQDRISDMLGGLETGVRPS
jgi:ligand-binding SRPBCC domain-containing protein